MSGVSNIAAALDYEARGFALVPVEPGTKRSHTRVIQQVYGDPQGSWAPLRARPAIAAEIREWYACDPDTSLGLITGQPSGVVVIDVDGGARELDLPRTPTVMTGRDDGGAHVYTISRQPVKSTTCEAGSVRSDGNIVVLPPSVHPSGRRYKWLVSLDQAGFIDYDPALVEKLLGPLPTQDIYVLGCEPSERDEDDPRMLVARDKKLVAQAAVVLGIQASSIGRSFRCVLPGHDEKSASASLWLNPTTGTWGYHDFHHGKHGSPEWLSLAAVYAAQVSGQVRRLNRPSEALWFRRLAAEIGVVEPIPVPMPPLPSGSTEPMRKVYGGFRLLAGLRRLREPGEAFPFTREFAGPWCGIGVGAARAAIDALIKAGVIRRAGGAPMYGGTKTTWHFLPGATR